MGKVTDRNGNLTLDKPKKLPYGTAQKETNHGHCRFLPVESGNFWEFHGECGAEPGFTEDGSLV